MERKSTAMLVAAGLTALGSLAVNDTLAAGVSRSWDPTDAPQAQKMKAPTKGEVMERKGGQVMERQGGDVMERPGDVMERPGDVMERPGDVMERQGGKQIQMNKQHQFKKRLGPAPVA